MPIVNNLILIFAILFFGFLSIFLGKELCWDLANYHYYNPYAFLHHRETLDYWPSSFVHMYFSPTLDFLSYFLIQSFPSIVTVFLLGSIHGINFWLLFLIARHFLPASHYFLTAFLLAAFGLYGPTALPGIGSFQGDNTISLFILGFVLLQIKQLQFYLQKNSLPKLLIFLSGLLLGIGTGLKLTAGLFVPAAFLASVLLPFPWRIRLTMVLILGIAILSGILISSGYWMLLLWKNYHNPFFPLLNNLFHSPDFPAINWRDTRFLPHGLLQSLFYPFYFSWTGQTGDSYFRDFRFVFVYVFFVVFILSMGWSLLRKKTIYIENKIEYWLFLFFIFSYVIWQWFFSIMRYAVVLEMLAPLIIYLLILRIFKKTGWHTALLVPTFFLIAICMVPTCMIRAPWYHSDFFNVKMPSFVKQTPNAIVLVAYSAYALSLEPRPQNFLIPFFPSDWRFIGVPFRDNKADDFDTKVTQHIATLVNQQTGPIYLLTSSTSLEELYRAVKKWGLVPHGECSMIPSDRQKISHTDSLLCPVVKNTVSAKHFFP